QKQSGVGEIKLGKLSREQKVELDNSLPPKVRKFLETADKIIVWAEFVVEGGELKPAMNREFKANYKSDSLDEQTRIRLLKALYTDAATGSTPAICYLPSHSIVAYKGTERVDIEICFGCNRFTITG